MALVVKDRVKETTTTTGTGTITLAGAADGYQSFAAIGNGNTTYYAIVGDGEWEVGIGTYTSSGTTLSRTTVLESSNSGSLVNFSSGEKQVFCTFPAERMITVDNDGSGSGLDADKLDGVQGSSFLRSDTADTATGKITFSGGIDGFDISNGISGNNFNISGVNALTINDPGEGITFTGTNNVTLYAIDDANDNIMNFSGAAQLQRNGNKVWDAGNDGSGSGLDADTLDGSHASAFATSGHTHDDRYYTETEADSRFVNVTGDTMSGNLTVNAAASASKFTQITDGIPRNNLGAPTVTEMALFDTQFNNKTEYYPIANLKFYTSTDGTNWTEYTGFSDTQKENFLHGDDNSGIYIPNGTAYFRIELTNDGNYVYLNALYMYWSSNSHSTTVKIRKQRGDGVWSQHTNSNTTVSSWPGHLYLPFSTIAFNPSTTSTGHYRTVHFDFEPNWSTGQYASNNISLNKMQVWGGYPSGRRNVYHVDKDHNVRFPDTVYVNNSSSDKVFSDTYHPNADKWTTARTLSLSGDASGSVSWDGSSNATLSVTVNNDSHNHNHSDGSFTVNGHLNFPLVNAPFSSGSHSSIDPMSIRLWDNYSAGGPTTYGTVLDMYGRSGHSRHQIHMYNQDLRVRSGWYGNDTWSSWDRLFTDSYHPNADKWTTARTLSLTGDVTGSVSWDGSGNVSMSTAVGDAQTIDGYDSSRFFRRQGKASATVGGGWMTVASTGGGRSSGEVIVTDADSGDHAYIRIHWMRSYSDSNFTVINCGGHANRITGARVLYNTADNTYGTKYLQVYVTANSNYEVNVYELGDINDFGVPSVVTPVIQNSISGYALHGNELTGLDAYGHAAEEGILAGGTIRSNTGMNVNGNTVWHAGNDGGGSGLDADTVDGVQLSAITHSGDSVSLTGDVTGSATVSSDGSISVSTNIAANVVNANELNVSGVGTTSQYLRSDGDGSFTWATPPDTDTVYTHPTHPGDDIDLDTGALTGATVISDLDFNVTTDTLGHVTDANASVATRTLTPANIGAMATSHPANNITSTHLYMSNGDGFVWNDTTNVMSVRKDGTDYVNIDAGNISSYANNYTHPSHPGDDINLDTGALSGATVISDLDFNVTTDTLGHVTDANATYSTRNLTANDVGASPAVHNHEINDLIGVYFQYITSWGTNQSNFIVNPDTAGPSSVTGTHNYAIGNKSLEALSSGIGNTALGSNTARAVTTGSSNTGIGAYALSAVSTGSNNTAVGRSALYVATGSDNTAVGYYALDSVTTGSRNCSFGNYAGGGMTTGLYNTSFGYYADVNTDTTGRVSVGAFAGEASGGGMYQVNVGYQAGRYSSSTRGVNIGSWAGYNSDGLFNICIGYYAGQTQTTGDYNILLGSRTELDTSTDSSNCLIGPASGDVAAITRFAVRGCDLDVNTTALYYGAEIRAGGDVVAYYSSDISLKENIVEIPNALDKVSQIRGVTYDWKDDYLESKGGEDDYFNRKHDVGVIAQEVEEVLPEVVAERKDGTKAVRYEKLTALLIESVKELKAEVDTLKAELKEFKDGSN